MRIAFAGNPNSGKTTMYNALTGKNEKVGNWAGVTVDKKEAPIKKQYAGSADLLAVDLPGAYSMSPYTSEESVTSTYIKNENPDVIINIVDATNLSRSLFFTTQLLELGVPMVVALNKADINEKKHTEIDVAALSNKLGCPVVETVSTSAEGLAALVQSAVSRAGKVQSAPFTQGDIDLTDKKAVEAADRKRYAFVNKLVSQVEKRQVFTKDKNFQDKIDEYLTSPWLGIPIFALVMFLVFQISQAWVGPFLAEGHEFENGTVIPGLVTLIDLFKDWVGNMLSAGHPFLVALLTEGIIGGVSAVVGFLPLVMVMYFLIALLEDCGYMARATVVLDPIFKKVGLSGKSVIPFVIGTGCAVPGVMAARTIRNERERNATVMLAPFMPCGAKLPVISLFAGVFFENAAWVGTLMYFVGIAIILLGALLVNWITGNRNRKSFFIIELPEYKIPSFSRAFSSMCARGWSYIVKAGTIILLCNATVYIMQSFNWQLQLVAEDAVNTSILATIANPIALLLVPVIGYASWQLAAAAVTGFIAKENVVGTLAVCFGISNLIDPDALELVEGAAGIEIIFGSGVVPQMTAVAALAYLMFNLFSPPCFAAIGAMNAELSQKKWLWSGLALQLGVGYTLGFLVFQIGTLITTGAFGAGFIPGLIAVTAMVGVVIYLCVRADKKLKLEALSGKK
ncbi:MAG: ferrous iron transport protein B [Oscillospiraceae bacterium]|nr:ferrous iron transport protein B [Oscillospiraceae bacterium]